MKRSHDLTLDRNVMTGQATRYNPFCFDVTSDNDLECWLGPLEVYVMEQIWRRFPNGKVAEMRVLINSFNHHRTYSTYAETIRRLICKGLLTRIQYKSIYTKNGLSPIVYFTIAMTREEFIEARVREALGRIVSMCSLSPVFDSEGKIVSFNLEAKP